MTQPKGKRPNTAAVCAELAAPVAEGIGVYLWDVVFEKEGAGWDLRYFIDKDADGGVTIDECEAFSRAMSDLLDEKDPIPQSYTLEVGSPGVERRLTKDWHFRKYLGCDVLVRLIRPVEGERDFIGTLSAYHEDGTISVELDGDVEMAFTLAETAFVRLYEEF